MNSQSHQTDTAAEAFAQLGAWVQRHGVQYLELVVPDQAGKARGKIQPVAQLQPKDMKLPIAVFGQTVHGSYHMRKDNVEDRDMLLRPDISTARIAPWIEDPTGTVLMDCFDTDGGPVAVSPRQVLKHVLAQYEQQGWSPIVAPEVEFYLSGARDQPPEPEPEDDGDMPQRADPFATDPYGVDQLYHLKDFFADLTQQCEQQSIPLGAVSQELGPGQYEINFHHGEPLKLADDLFHFKRTLKRVAAAHRMQATFLAKLDPEEPGSAMHFHQSVYDAAGSNVFSTADGQASPLFLGFLGGQQQYLAQALLLLAPYANSYRRFLNYWSSPVNLEWGIDNRTVGLRVPRSSPQARRVENRLAGSDVNPYLATAATLACGLIGMKDGLEPRPAVKGSAYDLPFALHRHFYGSLDSLRDSAALSQVLGDEFVALYCAVKEQEYREFQERIPAWEREELSVLL